MRVRARDVDWDQRPSTLTRSTKRSQTFLTVGREYEVYALDVVEGRPKFQVVDDFGHPSWEASWLFDVIEMTIPTDWICNVVHEHVNGAPALFLGPTFVASDPAAHDAMVELDREQIGRFRTRVEKVDDRRIIRDALIASVNGPFFSDFSDSEFALLLGAGRTEVMAFAQAWPGNETDSRVDLAVANALENLADFPHGQERSWDRFLTVPPARLREVLARWRSRRPSGAAAV